MDANSESREKSVPKYFKKAPEQPGHGKSIVLMVLGGLFALIGIIAGSSSSGGGSSSCVGCGLFGGLVPFLVGAVMYSNENSEYKKKYDEAEPKPTDAQMDAWLAEDIARVKGESLRKLDLLPEQVLGKPDDPIVVVGPANEAKWAIGKDGIIRFSFYDILVVYLTSYHLAAYQCILDLATGTRRSESTQEYHYTDVVAVSTRTAGSGLIAVMVDGTKKEVASYQKFALSVASGEKIEVAVFFPQLEDIIGKGKLAPTGADKAISAIRAMLREKKGGVEEE